MSRITRILAAAMLSFMFAFMVVGYAALSDSFKVTGNAEIKIPYGLFITSIETTSESGVDKNNVTFLDYSTTVDATISKNPPSGSSWNQSYPTGKVTYRITVFNNTRFKYAYRDIYYQSGLYYNNSIGSANNSKIRIEESFPDGRTVEPGESLTFDVTYTISAGSRNNNDSNTDYRTLVNFQFGINVDRIEQATEVVHSKFLNILNTNSTYMELIDALDNKFDGSQEWTSNYIGNVTNASNEDSFLVNQLFAGQLQITVGKDEYPATVLIKHENLDGSDLTGDDYTATANGGSLTRTGCEMTLYLTIDPLNRADAYVPVYASVFTRDRAPDGSGLSDWYETGDMYLGTANVVTYNGGTGTGSFVTDNWRSSSASYTPVKGYTYRVEEGLTIKQIVSTVDPSAIAAFQDLLNRAKAIVDNRDYAGTGITVIEDMFEYATDFYTVEADGRVIAKSGTTRSRLIPIMKEFEHAIEVAEEAIKAATENAAN